MSSNNKMINSYLDADCLFNEAEVESAISSLATKISSSYSEENPLIVCILNGGLVIFGRLLPQLKFPLEIDYLHATRYFDNRPSHELNWISGPNQNPKGRTVILVDDILDEGITLAGIVDHYMKADAAKVIKVVLVEKQRNRKTNIQADLVGLQVPDRYVFGYGMDYRGYWRNAPGIYAEKE